MIFLLRLIIVCSLTCATFSAWSMDLLQVYRSALEQNPGILASRANTEVERERLPQAWAQLLPNISASYTRNRNELTRNTPSAFQPEQESYTSDNRILTLRQPLFRLSQWAQYQKAKFQVKAADASLDNDVQNLASQIAGTYFEALLAKDNLALIVAQKSLYSSQLDASHKNFTAGMGTRTDIDDAQARLDMNLAQELEARQNQEYTLGQLQVMINDPIDTIVGLDLEKMVLIPPDPPELEKWRELAEEHSPEYQSFKAQLDSAAVSVDIARAGHYPTVDAIAQYSRSVSESVQTIHSAYENKTIGIQVSLPLFSAGAINSSIRQAQFSLENAKQNIETKRRELGLLVQKQFRNVTEGILKVRALEQAEKSATQMVLSNQKSFQAGMRTRLDILNAEQQRISVLVNLAHQRYLYILSRIRLLGLVGQITLERMEELNSWLRIDGNTTKTTL